MPDRALKLTIQFDGTAYHGWQIQPAQPTVQQSVTDALARILNGPVTLHGSGRTDAGVHALGQVAHFHTRSAMATANLVRGLNSLLPDDIAVTAAQEVPMDFHARYSARRRTYWYCIWNAQQPSPFFNRYTWHIIRSLDVAAMAAAAQSLVGCHDFSSFQGADREAVPPVREVFSVRLRKTRRNIILFEIQANAFLKHMVRNIVGTLVDVGLGKLNAAGMQQILQARDRSQAGEAAPARGLFLKEVEYPGPER